MLAGNLYKLDYKFEITKSLFCSFVEITEE